MEIAFKVKQDSDFYSQYFQAQAESQKFHDLALIFFKAHNLSTENYTQTERLRITLTPEEKEMYKSDILTKDDEYGLTGFKKNSQMNKSWFNDVYSQINHKIMDAIKFWHFGCFTCKGRYSLWDVNNEIYGTLSSSEEVKAPEWADEIKMSEYYQVIEGCKENG